MRVQFNYVFFSRRSVALLSFFPHLFLLACIVVCLLCLLAFFFSFFSKFSVYVFFIVCLFLDLLCWQQVCPVEKKKRWILQKQIIHPSDLFCVRGKLLPLTPGGGHTNSCSLLVTSECLLTQWPTADKLYNLMMKSCDGYTSPLLSS